MCIFDIVAIIIASIFPLTFIWCSQMLIILGLKELIKYYRDTEE